MRVCVVTISVAPLVLVKGAVAVLTLVAAPLAVKALSKPRSGFLYTASVPPQDLVGQVGITDVNVVTATFGRAFVVLNSQEHGVQVRSLEGDISPRGTRVLLKSYVPEEGYFLVSRAEEPTSEPSAEGQAS